MARSLERIDMVSTLGIGYGEGILLGMRLAFHSLYKGTSPLYKCIGSYSTSEGFLSGILRLSMDTSWALVKARPIVNRVSTSWSLYSTLLPTSSLKATTVRMFFGLGQKLTEFSSDNHPRLNGAQSGLYVCGFLEGDCSVLTVISDNVDDEFKTPRGIRGYTLLSKDGSLDFTVWKVAGSELCCERYTCFS